MFDKIFGDFVEMGVNILIAATVLVAVSISMGLSNQYHAKVLESQIVSKEIKEQRNNLFYNNTHVYQQDVVSLVLRYKGDRTVLVKLKDGSTHTWSRDTSSTDYKISNISSLLPKDVLYDADIIYGPNVYDVVGYQFVEHTAGCGR